jgi:tryptophan-rich sensory protein
MKTQDILKLLGSIGLCQLAGILGSFFTMPSIPTWYASLAKPSFTPPNWLFGPVWITLYTLMGISLYLVWQKGFKSRDSKIALSVFGIQLFLNSIWSIIFFGLQAPFYGFAVIVILWAAIVGTIVLFYRISKTAGLLLLPYIAWVTLATALNFFIWTLNK